MADRPVLLFNYDNVIGSNKMKINSLMQDYQIVIYVNQQRAKAESFMRKLFESNKNLHLDAIYKRHKANHQTKCADYT